MTSYDGSAPAPGSSGSGGRRRALGRGPGTSLPERPGPPAHDADARSVDAGESENAAPAVAGESENAPPAVAGESERGREAVEAATGPVTASREDDAARGGPTEHESANGPGAAETTVSPDGPEPGPDPAGEPSDPAEGPETGLGLPARPSGGVALSVAVTGPSSNAPADAPGRGAAAEAEPFPGPVAVAGPETADGVFKVRLANFEGPFDLLLQLISKHKLDVTEVALSKVTDEFMAHIRAMGPDWDLDQTTEFLVVAATLLHLKAARLLPTAEVEDEADLALLEARDLLFARLLQYRAYKQIAEIFNGRTEEEARRYPRTVGLEPHHAELLPEVVISIGPEGFAKLAVKAMQPRPKPQVYVDHIHAPLVSVQEQAGIVVARLRELGEVSFRVLVEDTDDTLTVVARFLALLELYREKAVALEQETALGELVVRWTGGDGDETPVVTDEFDRPPEEPEEEKKA
ncbi:segregation/condensation protein A [Streptomyces sp. NPDC047079]|uniref:segregation and condensation protein A n=1 Tax=Streptomyces sp. NPDC047079 TaxID=3154607 RepID=UPI0033D3FFC4